MSETAGTSESASSNKSFVMSGITTDTTREPAPTPAPTPSANRQLGAHYGLRAMFISRFGGGWIAAQFAGYGRAHAQPVPRRCVVGIRFDEMPRDRRVWFDPAA